MANNQKFFCMHCNKNTTFYLESDLLWYCDECENVLGSRPFDGEEEFDLNEDSEIFRCPFCHNLLSLDSLVDDHLCPICFESLVKELERLGYEYDEEYDLFYKL